MLIKFFKRDIVSGKADAIGDKFTANFMGDVCEFIVVEICNGFFFAEL